MLSYGRRSTAAQIRDSIAPSAQGRVGISPEYGRLDHTPRALRYARVALETLDRGSVGVRQLRDSALSDLVIANLDVTRRFVHRVLGRVLALADDESSILLSTSEAWLETNGSAAAAGRILYCHENTVRHRIRRLEEQLDGNLADPNVVAELATALQAIRTFPELARGSVPMFGRSDSVPLLRQITLKPRYS